MPRVKWRWILPIGHLVVDCVLLVALIAYSNRMFPRQTDIASPSGSFQDAVFLQDRGYEWEPRFDVISGPFMAIASGNLPAGLVAAALRPEAQIPRRKHKWDHIWFLVHEALAFLGWFTVGALVDAGHPRLGKVMLGYLAVRFMLALTGRYEIEWKTQTIFWMCFTMWLIGLGVSHLIGLSRQSPQGRTKLQFRKWFKFTSGISLSDA